MKVTYIQYVWTYYSSNLSRVVIFYKTCITVDFTKLWPQMFRTSLRLSTFITYVSGGLFVFMFLHRNLWTCRSSSGMKEISAYNATLFSLNRRMTPNSLSTCEVQKFIMRFTNQFVNYAFDWLLLLQWPIRDFVYKLACEFQYELPNFATKFGTFVVKVSWNRL